MKEFYDKFSIVDFGMYRGYQVGIVFVCDPKYIEWCLLQDKFEFILVDLEELNGSKIINLNLDYYSFKEIQDLELIPYLNYFKTFSQMREGYEKLMVSENKPIINFYFKEETITSNSKKLNKINCLKNSYQNNINKSNQNILNTEDNYQIAINKGLTDIPYGSYQIVKYMGITTKGLRKIVYENLDTGELYPFFGIDGYPELWNNDNNELLPRIRFGFSAKNKKIFQ